MASRIYVGIRSVCKGEVFRSTIEPTMSTHGDTFAYIIGPFRTIQGAKAMLHYGPMNPHIQCVSDAEKVGRKYVQNLASMGKVRA